LVLVSFAIGVVVQVCLVAFGTWELVKLRSGATNVACAMGLSKLDQLCEQAGVLEPPQLRVHRFTLGAFVSWLDPRVIYLPADYSEWTAEELNAALAHELMHVSRRDGLWRYVSRVCAGVLWFHPGAWLLYRELCLAQELSADRTASSLIPRSGYLVGLAKLGLRLDREERGRMPNLSGSVVTKDLIRRIEMLK
jgi:beta-lactamase regulating signal transducer with metallopeptidase domain